MRTISRIAIFFWASVFCAVAESGEDGKIQLMHANGKGYPFEFSASIPPGQYFELVCGESCVLRRTDVTVKKAKIDTHEESGVSGYIAKAQSAKKSLFLIKGLKGLKEGSVKTWYFNSRFQESSEELSDSDLSEPQAKSWQIDGTPLSITGDVTRVPDASCSPKDPDCPRWPSVKWKFRFGEVERTLFTLGGSELSSSLPIEDLVVWIGDLDGDGKPDLVLRPQDRGDYLELHLFLSTALYPGKPWRPSAKFSWWDPTNPGC